MSQNIGAHNYALIDNQVMINKSYKTFETECKTWQLYFSILKVCYNNFSCCIDRLYTTQRYLISLIAIKTKLLYCIIVLISY